MIRKRTYPRIFIFIVITFTAGLQSIPAKTFDPIFLRDLPLSANEPSVDRQKADGLVPSIHFAPVFMAITQYPTLWLYELFRICTLPLPDKAISSDQPLLAGNQNIPSNTNIIKLEDVEINISTPRLLLDRFSSGGSFHRTDTLIRNERFSLNSWENSPVFEVVVPNGPGINTAAMQFRLEGIEPQWRSLKGRKIIRFKDLPPGNHKLQLRALNPNGDPGRVSSYPVHIASIWYQSPEIRLIFLLLTLTFIPGAVWILRRIKVRTGNNHHDARMEVYTNLTHELRTPLTIISSVTDQILDNPDEWLQDGMYTIKSKSTELLQLVNQMNDISLLESGTVTFNPVQADMIHFLSKIVDSFQIYARTKDIRIHLLPEPDQLMMDFDPRKMHLVISNLLSNAIKFTPDGGDIYINIQDKQKNKKEKCLIRITDTGVGLSKIQLDHLNDRTQTSKMVKGTRTGSGIGLELTRNMIRLMKGKITVDSKLGKGATFTITMPVARKSPISALTQYFSRLAFKNLDGNPSTQELANKTGKENPEGQLLLLIEETQDLIEQFPEKLRKKFRIVTAQNALDGYNKAVKLIPDIILSHPDDDDLEGVQRIKSDSRTSHIPIIAITCSNNQLTNESSKVQAVVSRDSDLNYLEELIDQLTRNTPEYTAADESTKIQVPQNGKEDAFLTKVRNIVEANISREDFGIAQLCQEMHVSRTQLHRKLKAISNKSTSKVIRSIRLQKARELLQNSDQNVSEVGYAVGFSNRSHFTQVFTEEFGQPPSTFKRM